MYLKQLIISFRTLVVLSFLTGVIYPLGLTAVSQMVFPNQANGSLIMKDRKALGSKLIGQPFNDPKFFWSRLSATSPAAYNASGSSGSNLGPLNPALVFTIQRRIDALKAADPDNHRPIPVDLVTSSASGLDPHISPAAAIYQLLRVAKARGLSEPAVADLVHAHTEGRTFGILGEPRVNVLELNLALEDLKK